MEEDDLTASHWDDVVTPNSGSIFNIHNSSLPPVMNNEFRDLSIEDNEEGKEDEHDREEDEHQEALSQNQTLDLHAMNEGEEEQLKDIHREGRKEHKHQLLSQLTVGAEESPLEAAVLSTPERIEPSESLFDDKDSILKDVVSPESVSENTERKTSGGAQPGLFKSTRLRKYNPKTVVQHLNAESGKGSNLGPLGENAENLSESNTNQTNKTKEELVREHNAPLYHVKNAASPQKFSETGETHSSETYTSMPSKKMDLDITVSDPMKVGDITNAHIVYSIKTKQKNSDAHLLPDPSATYTVMRRYNDFRWIYHQLQNNHPGRFIPPPPTKQTYIGRFNENFIENRRLSLEKMLVKTSQNPHLYDDPDFILFLTSENFAQESKDREIASGSGASLRKDGYLDNDNKNDSSEESSVLILAPSTGFMSSIFSLSQKINDPDQYFVEKKEYIDSLENSLRLFHKSLDLISSQRSELVTLLDEISITVDELANAELLKATSELLFAFSEVQLKIKDNLDRVNLQEQLSLGFTAEEYIRLIGSIKHTFETRSKLYQQYHSFNQEYVKKQSQVNKLSRKYTVQNDKLNLLNFETEKLKSKAASFEKSFNAVSSIIKDELEKFELEKIDDFRNSVEIFIESSIESQKEAIELWETFYERQSLADA